MQSEQINELATALSKAQSEIKPALKDSDNPFFKSKYADLASVQSACMPFLTKNGLSVLQAINYVNGETTLETTLLHSSGQWIKSIAPVKPVKNDPQGLGSALTYMRRYSLAALVGVSQEDDDGNGASNNEGTKQTKKQIAEDTFKPAPVDRMEQEMMRDSAINLLNACASVDNLKTVWVKNQPKWAGKLDKDLYEEIEACKDHNKTELEKQ